MTSQANAGFSDKHIIEGGFCARTCLSNDAKTLVQSTACARY